MVGLFHGVPGARAFRRHLATWSAKPGAGAEVLSDALGFVDPAPCPAPQAGDCRHEVAAEVAETAVA